MDLIEELRRRVDYLTTKEVMQLLRVRRNTLCHWVRRGTIGAIRSGNGYLFDPRILADWLRERETAAITKRRVA
jgi:excisionase family DNA binding protein